MAKPKILPDDYHSDDTWLTDRGPHYCIFCGYDILTKDPTGKKVVEHSNGEVQLEHLKQFRWHGECVAKDPKYRQAMNLITEGLRRASGLLYED